MLKNHFAIWIFFYLSLLSCGHREKEEKIQQPLRQNSNPEVLDSSQRVLTRHIQGVQYLFFDTIRIRLSDEDEITRSNLFEGIYEIERDSIIRRNIIVTKKWAFLTTFDDVGMGQRGNLYAFDLIHKLVIKDSSFDRNCQYSSAGVFVFSPANQRFLSIDRPGRYEALDKFVLPAELFEISGNYYHTLKLVCLVGEEIPENEGLLDFYKNANLPVSTKVLPLPHDWNGMNE